MIRVEREFAVELIAETKVCVAVLPGGCDDLDGKDMDFGLGGDNGDYEDLESGFACEEL